MSLRDTLRRRALRLLAGVTALAALAAAAAEAHPGHDGGIYAALVGVEEAPEGVTGLRVLLVNNTPGAATLRGLSTSDGGNVALVRNRRLLGLEFGQPVRFLRLEQGERLLLALPGYSVRAERIDLDAVIRGEIEIVADFGPLGQLPLEVVGAPPTASE